MDFHQTNQTLYFVMKIGLLCIDLNIPWYFLDIYYLSSNIQVSKAKYKILFTATIAQHGKTNISLVYSSIQEKSIILLNAVQDVRESILTGTWDFREIFCQSRPVLQLQLISSVAKFLLVKHSCFVEFFHCHN